jgi:hypothetical protein
VVAFVGSKFSVKKYSAIIGIAVPMKIMLGKDMKGKERAANLEIFSPQNKYV